MPPTRPTPKMNRSSRTIRLSLIAALATTVTVTAAAQAVVPSSARAFQQAAQVQPQQPSTLPATPATSLPAPNTEVAPIAATPNGESIQSKNLQHRAEVTYAAGLLYIRADNSSLNQILRQICRITGMTVTGGVADERVFGTYGPAETATILATLLDGTGSNMLLRGGPNSTVAEMILTPRNGGATPPNPNAPGFDDGPEEPQPRTRERDPGGGAARAGFPLPPRGFPGEAQQPGPPPQQQQPVQQVQQAPQAVPSGPVSIPQPMNNVNGSPSNSSPTASTFPTTDSVPLDSVPTPSTTPSTAGIVDAPNPPPAGSTTGADSTPESIFQQLQQMQSKTPAAAPATSTQAAPTAGVPVTSPQQ